VINILRYGEAIVDLAGFFEPLKYLYFKEKLKELLKQFIVVYNEHQVILQEARWQTRAVEGVYWSMV
jgi:hypothetical protein